MRRPPYIAGFSDELQKIARAKQAGLGTMGALIGGGAGALLPGNKIRNAVIGGAIGGVAGGVVGAGKKVIFDPNHHRNAQLAAQPAPGDPNYVPTWQQGYQ